jgi:hypothetical protein
VGVDITADRNALDAERRTVSRSSYDAGVDDGFFTHVRDAVEGFAASVAGTLHITSHSRGVKVWFSDASREHYEAQLVRVDAGVRIEIGFHTEHPNGPENGLVLQHLMASETRWRRKLGSDAEAGAFLGRAGWLRISECWESPEDSAVDAAIDVAARLADYIKVLEPIRRARS